MENTETLKPREVAQIMGINVITARKMCKEGKLFEVKNIGTGSKRPTYRIVKKSFEQYLGKQV